MTLRRSWSNNAYSRPPPCIGLAPIISDAIFFSMILVGAKASIVVAVAAVAVGLCIGAPLGFLGGGLRWLD
jgi:hypothetical protein